MGLQLTENQLGWANGDGVMEALHGVYSTYSPTRPLTPEVTSYVFGLGLFGAPSDVEEFIQREFPACVKPWSELTEGDLEIFIRNKTAGHLQDYHLGRLGATNIVSCSPADVSPLISHDA